MVTKPASNACTPSTSNEMYHTSACCLSCACGHHLTQQLVSFLLQVGKLKALTAADVTKRKQEQFERQRDEKAVSVTMQSSLGCSVMMPHARLHRHRGQQSMRKRDGKRPSCDTKLDLCRKFWATCQLEQQRITFSLLSPARLPMQGI